jgi:hypothetical protein
VEIAFMVSGVKGEIRTWVLAFHGVSFGD